MTVSALLGLLAVAAYATVRPTYIDTISPLSTGFPWLAMLSAAAVLLFPLDRGGIAEPLVRKPQVLLGGGAVLLVALIGTFEDPARGFVEGVGTVASLGWCWLLVTIVLAFASLASRQGRFAVLAVAGRVLVPPLTALLSVDDTIGWPVAITNSLMLLATAIALIALEFLGRQRTARIGADHHSAHGKELGLDRRQGHDLARVAL